MSYVIVTSRSLLWSLLSLAAWMAVFSAVVTPKWIVGPPIHDRAAKNETTGRLEIPSLGIYNSCNRLNGPSGKMICGDFNANGFATNSEIFPGCWKAALFFLSLGLAVMGITVIAAFLGYCVQSICRKSIFNLAGVIQAVAAIFYVLGVVLYLGGLGAKRVAIVCGPDADAFYLGDCAPGWAFYSAVAGIVLTIVCASLSSQAEKSTASDKVQDKMNQGQTLICLA